MGMMMMMRGVDLRGDLLLGDVIVGRGVGGILTLTESVDLVVGRRPMMIAVLTGPSHGPLNVRRVPGADAGDLTQTLVGLAGKLLGSPSAGDALEAVTLGDGDAVDHLVLLEDGADLDRLLEEGTSEVDLVGHGASVDLNLHQMGLLLLERRLADLRMRQHAHDGAVSLHSLQLACDGRSRLLRMLLGVLGEGLLLALVPVLVEAALHLVA